MWVTHTSASIHTEPGTGARGCSLSSPSHPGQEIETENHSNIYCTGPTHTRRNCKNILQYGCRWTNLSSATSPHAPLLNLHSYVMFDRKQLKPSVTTDFSKCTSRELKTQRPTSTTVHCSTTIASKEVFVVSSAELWKMNTLSTDETPLSGERGQFRDSKINRGGCIGFRQELQAHLHFPISCY